MYYYSCLLKTYDMKEKKSDLFLIIH